MPSLDAKPYCAAEGFREEFGQCEELGQAFTRACDAPGWEVNIQLKYPDRGWEVPSGKVRK